MLNACLREEAADSTHSPRLPRILNFPTSQLILKANPLTPTPPPSPSLLSGENSLLLESSPVQSFSNFHYAYYLQNSISMASDHPCSNINSFSMLLFKCCHRKDLVFPKLCLV